MLLSGRIMGNAGAGTDEHTASKGVHGFRIVGPAARSPHRLGRGSHERDKCGTAVIDLTQ